ncbi:MAG: hypothetical protein JW704_08115 [Anaerolineaceae bacterium]|nr:hypothetical protein [Anaerolineaceae bacterium]
MDHHRQYRSIFWPIVLLGVGAVWLLSNLGYIQAIDVGFLVRLWPVLLIIIGMDILLGRIAPWLSALLGLAVIAGLIAVLIYAPSLGLTRPAELNSEKLIEPIGGASAAIVDLRLSLDSVDVTSLSSGENLIEAEMVHYGEGYLNVSGEAQKKIVLGTENLPSGNTWFTFPSIGTGWKTDQYWKIGLTDRNPLDLSVDGSLGSVDLDLSKLQLTDLNVNVSMGSMDIYLPQSTDRYDVDIDGSAGALKVTLPAATNLSLHLDGSAGSSTFTLPPVYDLRIEVLDGGLGSMDLPEGLNRVSGSGDAQEGVWESDGYDAATYKILIIISHVGPGSINFR